MTVTYSLELLRRLGTDLHTVADVMDGRNADAQHDAQDLGRQVAGALDDFRGNWDDKRELLVRSLRSVGDMAQSTADSFQEFDEAMAEKVREILEGPA